MRKLLNFLFPKINKPTLPSFQVGDFFQITQVETVPVEINALFNKKFGDNVPLEPIHFVASYKLANGNWLPMGYVHYAAFEDCYLCGGLVVDEMAYRQMDKTHRQQLKQQGGVGDMLIKDAIKMLPGNTAVWAYTGVVRSRVIAYSAGFVKTESEHLIVCWQKDLDEADKSRYIEKFIAIGPF